MTETIVQRPLRGSRISTFYPVKNLPSLASIDSAFQLQEYISLVIRVDVHDVETIVSIPGRGTEGEKPKSSDSSAVDEAKPGKGEIVVDEACWIYEHLRRLAQDLSHPLITMLQQECTRATCPQMKAGEWLYLCVAHGNDAAMEQCCAIDYILHTLDSATALLNSPRAFPSRLSIPQPSHRHFSSLARRLGRIFAHAYFHHREAFEQAEAESSLYARFLALSSKFDLVPAEFLVIPPRLSANDDTDHRRDMQVSPPRLLGASITSPLDRENNSQAGPSTEPVPDWQNTRERSKSPPGLGSPAGTESPRKMGRSRTDTMVYSEAVNIAEELAKADESERESTEANSASGLSSGSRDAAESLDAQVIENVLGTSDTGTVLESTTIEEPPATTVPSEPTPDPEHVSTSDTSAVPTSTEAPAESPESALPEGGPPTHTSAGAEDLPLPPTESHTEPVDTQIPASDITASATEPSQEELEEDITKDNDTRIEDEPDGQQSPEKSVTELHGYQDEPKESSDRPASDDTPSAPALTPETDVDQPESEDTPIATTAEEAGHKAPSASAVAETETEAESSQALTEANASTSTTADTTEAPPTSQEGDITDAEASQSSVHAEEAVES